MVRISGTQKKLGVALVVLAGLVVMGGVFWAFPSASNQGYAPEQPIPFSHKLHAGDNKIQCLYCHSNADKSKHASVPSLNVCLNCHTVVKTDSPYIQQIQKAFAEGKPIEWVRIHELPDHAHFTHKRHVAAGVSCETCHGDVSKMERVYQFAPLTMGWCMECHRGQTTPPEVLRSFQPDSKLPKGHVAPVNCSTCHK